MLFPAGKYSLLFRKLSKPPQRLPWCRRGAFIAFGRVEGSFGQGWFTRDRAYDWCWVRLANGHQHLWTLYDIYCLML